MEIIRISYYILYTILTSLHLSLEQPPQPPLTSTLPPGNHHQHPPANNNTNQQEEPGGNSTNEDKSEPYIAGLLDCGKSHFTVVHGEMPPYSFTRPTLSGNVTKGSVYKTAESTVQVCCGSNVTMVIVTHVNKVRDVEERIQDADIAFPVVKTSLLVNTGVTYGYLYLPVIETTGSVVLLSKTAHSEYNAVAASLISCWPLALIVLFSAGLAGVIVWILDRSWNDVDFPKAYLQGGWEGTWWAFVTMTTVGYGDKAPKSVPARCFGLIWMFFGIILMSVFTATLTTALSAEQNQDFEMKGTNIGVVDGSMEEIVAIKQGATVTAFAKIKDLFVAVANGSLHAGLMDVNFALYDAHVLAEEGLKIGPIIENRAAYGIIIQNLTSDIEQCFARQVSQSQFRVYDVLTGDLGKFEGRRHQIASQTTQAVLSNMYTICIVLAVLWVTAVTGCILWECFYYRPKLKRQSKVSAENYEETERKSDTSHEKITSVSSTTKMPVVD